MQRCGNVYAVLMQFNANAAHKGLCRYQEGWCSTPASNLTLPFAVRYLQTRSQATPGQANALVQFVVAYQ